MPWRRSQACQKEEERRADRFVQAFLLDLGTRDRPEAHSAARCAGKHPVAPTAYLIRGGGFAVAEQARQARTAGVLLAPRLTESWQKTLPTFNCPFHLPPPHRGRFVNNPFHGGLAACHDAGHEVDTCRACTVSGGTQQHPARRRNDDAARCPAGTVPTSPDTTPWCT